jgi:hypothetical protein
MSSQIRPTRLDVTDRFPMLAFKILADDDVSHAEVAIATDPALFSTDGKAKRTRNNFYSTRGNGGVLISGRQGSYAVPPEVLARMVGNPKLYFGLATKDKSGAMKVAFVPGPDSPYVNIRQLSSRSMSRVRLLPSRQQIAGGYGKDQNGLEWAGDTATPGMEPVPSGANAGANGADKANGATQHATYDDGFGPMPGVKGDTKASPDATPLTAPAPGAPATPATPAAQGLAVALDDERIPVKAPTVTVAGTAASLAIDAALAVAAGPLAPFILTLKTAAGALGCSVGLGPQVGAGLGAGGALGAGIIFGKDGDYGIYGGGEIDIGFITSISATAVVTIVKGGIDAFNGWNFAFAVNGGEGVVGGAAALFTTSGDFVGVSANVGIGAGFSPVDFYIAIQRTWATKVMSLAQGLEPPVARAMVFGKEDFDKIRDFKAADWTDLIQWKVPAPLQSTLEGRGFAVQKIEEAVGDLNLDFYKVEIASFPSGWDARKLLDHFITHINDFVDTDKTEFIPYDDSDKAKLASPDPVGAVFYLDIQGPDNAAVVLSDAAKADLKSADGPNYYCVTTINTPKSGDHPVTGNRQFGFYGSGDNTIFYTRGADRATLAFPGTEGLIYSGAEALWESFQTKMTAFINSTGGSATAPKPFSERFNPTAIKLQIGWGAAQALAATDPFTVNWDDVELIAQPTDFSCWAAAGAMVVGWRDMVSLAPDSVAGICKRSTRSGLSTNDNAAFAREMGLTAVPPVCYTQDGFRNLIQSSGPLWVSEGVPPNLHAVVVTGMYSDGSKTFVRIADPWDRAVGDPGMPGAYANTHATGSRYIMSWDDFTAQYEAAMTGEPPNRQVLHAGGTGNHVANTGQTTPVGYAQGYAQRRKPATPMVSAKALGGESFTVNWDEVQSVAQPTDVSCWATSAAMVLGWRDSMSLTVEGIAAIAGQTTATGLDPAQVGKFASDVGLTAESPQSYTVDAFRNLVTKNGPLWVGAAVPGLHAIVVTGFYSDGAESFVRVTDPWDRDVGSPGAPGAYADTHVTGSRYIMRWSDFVAEYEKAATDFNAVNLQILHCGGTFGHTPNTGGGGTPTGYAMAADDAPAPAPAAAPRMIGAAPVVATSGGQGNVRWTLDQFMGPKYPNEVQGLRLHFIDAQPIILDQWPKLGDIEQTWAAFVIDWRYDGQAISDVRISNSGITNGQASLEVLGQISDDTATHPPASSAALKVRLTYCFRREGAADSVAVTDVHLFGDGTHEINSQWMRQTQAPESNTIIPVAQARGMGALEVASLAIQLVGGQAVSAPSWIQTKYPADTPPPGTREWKMQRKSLENVPWATGPVDKMTAYFDITWEYDGLSLRNIHFYPSVNSAVLSDISVSVDIIPREARRSNIYDPNSPMVAVVDLQFNYHFTHKIDNDENAVHRATIYGDGGFWQNPEPEWINGGYEPMGIPGMVHGRRTFGQ